MKHLCVCMWLWKGGLKEGFMLNCFSYCFHLTTSSFFYHNIIRLWSYLLRIKISLIFMLMLIMVQWVAFFDIFSYSRPSKEIWNENRGTYQGMYLNYILLNKKTTLFFHFYRFAKMFWASALMNFFKVENVTAADIGYFLFA